MMKTTLLCLHGWGGSKESFTELREALKGTEIEILTPDLPGFGEEPEPKEAWGNTEYAEWVEKWLRATGYELQERSKLAARSSKLFVIGHSHGGRIAMKLALRGNLPIDHLLLCAAAGIRHPRHFKRIIGLTLAKTGAFFLKIPGLKHLQPLAKKMLYKLVRVHDYEKASPIMRETMIHVTAEDFKPLVHAIKPPTDIFWGTEDGMTPIADAYILKKAIKDSQLHVFQGVRHRVHRDKASSIAEVIRRRLSA